MTEAFGCSGGIQQFNRDWSQAMAEASCTLELVVRRGKSGSLPKNIRQQAKPGKIGFVAIMLFNILRRRPQLIFCGHANYGLLCAVLCRAFSLPVWLHLHGIEAWKKDSRLWRWTVRQCALITCASRYTRKIVLRSTTDSYKVRVLPNTVAERFTPGPPSAELKARYGVEGKTLLLSVGRLASGEAYKGHEQVMDALADGLEESVHYLIGGSGDDAPRLKTYAKSRGVAHRVHFIGFIPDDELVDHYRTADVFVMPSSSEGFGIVYLEAMACGTPAVGAGAAGSVDPLSRLQGRRGLTIHQRIAEAISRPFDRGAVGVFSREFFSASVQQMHEFATGGGLADRR